MEKFNEDIKPTLRTPVSNQSQNFEKDFKKTMRKNGVKLTEEVDGLLTEKEFSLKKKNLQTSENGSIGVFRPETIGSL